MKAHHLYTARRKTTDCPPIGTQLQAHVLQIGPLRPSEQTTGLLHTNQPMENQTPVAPDTVRPFLPRRELLVRRVVPTVRFPASAAAAAAAAAATATAPAATPATPNTTGGAPSPPAPLPDPPSSPLLVLHVGRLAGHADQPPLRQDARRQPAAVDAARVEPHRPVQHLQPPRRVVPEEYRLGACPLPRHICCCTRFRKIRRGAVVCRGGIKGTDVGTFRWCFAVERVGRRGFVLWLLQ